MADILDGVDKAALAEFSKDFKELVRVSRGMSKIYARAAEKSSDYIKKYRTLIRDWNKKYSGIKADVHKTSEEVRLRLFLSGESLRDFFLNVASKIAGLRTIGINGFDEAKLEDSSLFSKKISAIKNELYLSYYFPEKGADTIYLKMADKKILILYNQNIITDEKSAEFKICAYFGASQDIDMKIDFYSQASSMGFAGVPTFDEKRAYSDRFEPTMLE